MGKDFTNARLNMVRRSAVPVAKEILETQSELRQAEQVVEEIDVKQDVKQKFFLNVQEKHEKSVTMTIRTTDEVKKRFDNIRKMYGYSQSEFLKAVIEMAEDEVTRNGVMKK